MSITRLAILPRHNSAYWHEVPYVGLGAAAHSYDIETRSWNVANIMDYVQAVECGKLPCEIETLNLSTRYNDLVTTALRTSEGIDLDQLRQRYGYTYYIYILRMSLPHIRRGVYIYCACLCLIYAVVFFLCPMVILV